MQTFRSSSFIQHSLPRSVLDVKRIVGLLLFIAEWCCIAWGCQFVSPFTWSKTFPWFPVWGDFKQSCEKCLHTGSGLNRSLHSTRVNTHEQDSGSYGKDEVNFVRNCQTGFQSPGTISQRLQLLHICTSTWQCQFGFYFLILVILIDVQRQLNKVLILICYD